MLQNFNRLSLIYLDLDSYQTTYKRLFLIGKCPTIELLNQQNSAFGSINNYIQIWNPYTTVNKICIIFPISKNLGVYIQGYE